MRSLGIPRENLRSDRGGIVAEYALIVALLLLVLLACLQVMLVIHVKNTLVDSAHQVARYGALAGASDAEIQQRAQMVVGQRLWSGYQVSLHTQTVHAGGLDLLEVQMSGEVPMLGWFGFGQEFQVSGYGLEHR